MSGAIRNLPWAILGAQNHRGKIPGAGQRVQCGAEPDARRATLSASKPEVQRPMDSGQGRAQIVGKADSLSIFFYHPKRALLHFAASGRKLTKPFKPLILLNAVCFQCLRDFGLIEFKSPRPDHFSREIR